MSGQIPAERYAVRVHLHDQALSDVVQLAHALYRNVRAEAAVNVVVDALLILRVVRLDVSLTILNVQLLQPEDLGDGTASDNGGPDNHIWGREIIAQSLRVHLLVRDADVQDPIVLLVQFLKG